MINISLFIALQSLRRAYKKKSAFWTLISDLYIITFEAIKSAFFILLLNGKALNKRFFIAYSHISVNLTILALF